MDEIVLEAKSKMGKSVDSLKESLSSLRTGKASPAMLNGIEIDYYARKVTIWLAGVSALFVETNG